MTMLDVDLCVHLHPLSGQLLQDPPTFCLSYISSEAYTYVDSLWTLRFFIVTLCRFSASSQRIRSSREIPSHVHSSVR